MWLENLSGTLAVREHKAGWGLGSWGLRPPPVVISSARLCFPSGPQGVPPERLVPLVTGGGWAVTRSVGIGLSAQAGPPSPLLGLAESSVQASSWAPGHREQIHLCFSGQEWLLPPRLSDCLLLTATTLDLLPQASCL